jgi:hypothetical protein
VVGEHTAVAGGDAVMVQVLSVQYCLVVAEGSLEVEHVVYRLDSRAVAGGEVVWRVVEAAVGDHLEGHSVAHAAHGRLEGFSKVVGSAGWGDGLFRRLLARLYSR